MSLTAYSNRTFSFKIKSPPTSWFLKVRADVCTHAHDSGARPASRRALTALPSKTTNHGFGPTPLFVDLHHLYIHARPQRCAGIEKGAARTVHETVGSVHAKHIYEIAKVTDFFFLDGCGGMCGVPCP